MLNVSSQFPLIYLTKVLGSRPESLLILYSPGVIFLLWNGKLKYTDEFENWWETLDEDLVR